MHDRRWCGYTERTDRSAQAARYDPRTLVADGHRPPVSVAPARHRYLRPANPTLDRISSKLITRCAFARTAVPAPQAGPVADLTWPRPSTSSTGV
eukprot:CAMPEP_0183354718 /NCGR_PEP_ID=MMETSP0164_2-20130417/37900_1 /TAXON_ID=221442 /ORGANISM="Coccolithus pelagicus ssp braarudi, Strain PLY182g" /LENGTH=94 /DNA_ID=CAMNT_0025527655 /DNA_START=300 /DNA_END=580 /DNA_ORIENTATION=-